MKTLRIFPLLGNSQKYINFPLDFLWNVEPPLYAATLFICLLTRYNQSPGNGGEQVAGTMEANQLIFYTVCKHCCV